MSRDDLIGKNAEVVATVGQNIRKHCPNAFVITITNPLDVMVWVMRESSGLPHQRVIAMARVLDSPPFPYFLAEDMGLSVEDATPFSLAPHPPPMPPPPPTSPLAGTPL